MIRLSRLGILIGEAIFGGIILVMSSNITCPFKMLFFIPCPFCGLTRAFKSLMAFELMQAISFNILIIPLVMLVIGTNIIILLEIIKNKSYLDKIFLDIYRKKRYIILICLILLIFSTLINIYHGI